MSDLDRFLDKTIPEPNSGCLLWYGAKGSRQYGHFALAGRVERAHRAAWLLQRGPIPTGKCVLHKCDNPGCVNLDHLFVGTHAENMADMRVKGRAVGNKGDANGSRRKIESRPRGEGHPRARLTDEAVRFARASALSHAEIARMFGVAKSTMAAARSGFRWRHVL